LCHIGGGKRRDGLDSKKGKESMATGGTIMRDVAIRQNGTPQYQVARVVAAVMAFGLLTALWVALWVPSAPIP
jgi:hypothetical protein